MEDQRTPVFDEVLYNRRISVTARFSHLYLLTMIFIRHVITGEHFLTFEAATRKVFPTRDEKNRFLVSRLLLNELDGSPRTLHFVQRLSQTIQKIPRCLAESLVCLTTKKLVPNQLIDMFCGELMFFVNDAGVLNAPVSLIGYAVNLLDTTRELYESAHFYRVEEFLFVTHKFLFDLEFLYLIVTYYLEFGHEQLRHLNEGNFLADTTVDELAEIREKVNSLVDSPTAKFQELISSAAIILPTYEDV